MVKFFKDTLDKVLKPIKKFPKVFDKIGDDIKDAFEKAGEEITKGTDTAINEAFVKPFAEMTAGIDALIQDFLRIICFLNNGITDPEEPRTLPNLTIVKRVLI